MRMFERFPELTSVQETLGYGLPIDKRVLVFLKGSKVGRPPTPLELDWYIAGGTDSPTEILKELNHQEAGMDGCDCCGSYNVLGPSREVDNTRDELLVLCPACWDDYGQEMEDRRKEESGLF